MKIALDARLFGLENTGIGRYTMGLVKGLAALDRKNEYLILLRDKYFKTLRLPPNWEKVRAEFRHYSFSEQHKLPKLLNSLSPTLTHFVHFNVPVFYKKPYVVTIHDLLMHRQKGLSATTLSAPVYYLKRLGYKGVFAAAVKNSRKIIVPSKAVKAEILSYYKVPEDKVVVIYEGVDALAQSGSEKEVLAKYKLNSGEYFIYAGNAYPHKNLKRAIEATILLNKRSDKKYKFVIACARSVFIQRLEKTISRLKAKEYVRCLGFVPDPELGVLYKNSVAFLYPTLSEGFGLPGLEAILSGTLALVSDISVLKETYKDNAVYFNPFDFSSIEKVMEETIVMQEEDRRESIERAQKFAKGYSWDKMAKETLRVYEDCARLRQG
jgi:glycosyltransferase involved in cell wall biosynthesis